MAPLLATHYIAHLALAFVFIFSGSVVNVQSYDFSVCLKRIKLDSYWVSSFYGVHPYAKVYVNDVYRLTTDSEATQEVAYGSNDYCVSLNEGDTYKMELWESNTLDDDFICWNADTINAAVDVGLNENSCTDTSGYTNFMDFFVTALATPIVVTSDNREYSGTAMNMQVGGSLAGCKTTCEGSSDCNYLSYGLIDGNTGNVCRMYTSFSSEAYNANAVSVSYACTVSEANNLGSGVCSTSTVYNTAACGWDSGDCCVATNSQLSNNDNCLDPLNQYTPPTPAPTTTTTVNSYIGDGWCDNSYNSAYYYWDGGDCCSGSCVTSSYTCGGSGFDCKDPQYTTTSTSASAITEDLSVCKWILDNVDGMEFSQIGDGVCDTASVALRYSYTLNGYGGTTTVNDATCNWDGGDCCTATNAAVSTDDSCLNPMYTTTTTTTTTSSTSSSTVGDETTRRIGNNANPDKLFCVGLVVTIATVSFF